MRMMFKCALKNSFTSTITLTHIQLGTQPNNVLNINCCGVVGGVVDGKVVICVVVGDVLVVSMVVFLLLLCLANIVTGMAFNKVVL